MKIDEKIVMNSKNEKTVRRDESKIESNYDFLTYPFLLINFVVLNFIKFLTIYNPCDKLVNVA